MTLWRWRKEDLPSVVFIVCLPVLVAIPQLLDWVRANPMLYAGMMANGITDGYLPGRPYIDPNNGFTTQALGYRAALDWIRGVVPWWNPYSGVGLPLAAEYQPGAFFPLTLLLLLPRGVIVLQLALQVFGGLGTYTLLRQLGVSRFAATLGGVLFAFNGTLAWLSHAPAQPAAFLPWMLLGVERAYAAARSGIPHGWRLLSLAMALSLMSAFPETAYINGLLALAWATLRVVELPAVTRLSYARRIAFGGIVGIVLAAPQVFAFFHFLPHAFIGGHTDFAYSALDPEAVIPSLLAPYAYGPIFAYVDRWPLLRNIWGGIGGYASVLLLVLAMYGLAARRTALAWLLGTWIVLALAKTFRIEPAVTLWNLIPGISIAAFARYAQPTWLLAFILLAAWALDDLVRERGMRRAPMVAAAAMAFLALGGGLLYGARLWPHFGEFIPQRNWALGSAAWAVISVVACLVLMRLAARPWAPRAIAALLALDAMLLFAIPTLSNPRAGVVDVPAIRYLQENLGLQRFYTLGPIQPNYGAYFGLASINHNYLPVSKRWVDWVRANLDSAADDVVFNGDRPRGAGEPKQDAELRRNLVGYEWAGVKYVIAPHGVDPLGSASGVRKVYSDALMEIFELRNPAPYFEVVAGKCRVEGRGRLLALANCDLPSTLIRRELFFPGWRATVSSADVPIAEHQGLFQSIALPVGQSEVRFEYAPPRIGWAWLAFFAALAAWVFPWIRHFAPRRAPR